MVAVCCFALLFSGVCVCVICCMLHVLLCVCVCFVVCVGFNTCSCSCVVSDKFFCVACFCVR